MDLTKLSGPILVTGAGGMLGWDLTVLFRRLFGESAVIVADRKTFDITSNEIVGKKLREMKPSIVLNAAAYTDVDGAEREPDFATQINGTAVSFLVRACQDVGAKFVHFGTDQVFDGKGQSPRTEEDIPHPVNSYGRSKLLGENAALSDARSLVLRVQWLYGERKDRFSTLKQRDLFTPFSDQYGAPTWTKHVAEVVADLLTLDATGLYHFSYDDYASWADVFAFVKQEWKLPVRLEPALTADRKLPAERPRFSVMSNKKLIQRLGKNGMGSWKEPLRKFLALVSQ